MGNDHVVCGKHHRVARVRYRHVRDDVFEEGNRNVDAKNAHELLFTCRVRAENGRRVDDNRFLDELPDKRFLPNPLETVLGAQVPRRLFVVATVNNIAAVARKIRKAHVFPFRGALGSLPGLVGHDHRHHLRNSRTHVRERLQQELVQFFAVQAFLPDFARGFFADVAARIEKVVDERDIGSADFVTVLQEHLRHLLVQFETSQAEQCREHDADANED